MRKVVIIGAGPAGLTAAYELLKQHDGYEVIVLEAENEVGGISKTVNADGNFIDLGGHRFFSKSQRVINWWESILLLQRHTNNGVNAENGESVMFIRKRISRIAFKGTFIDYPITLNWDTINKIGFPTTIRVGFSYIYACIRRLPENNLENFYINRFGKVLYSMFFEGYTEKLWGRHPRDISAEWGAQRVKGLSVRVVLRDFFGRYCYNKNRKVETSLIEQFYYPKYGAGQMWSIVAEKIEQMGGVILTGKCAVHIEREKDGRAKSVKCADDSEFPCDDLISTMPIKDLMETINDIPDEIKRAAGGLPYRDFQILGALIPTKKFRLRNDTKQKDTGAIIPDCWIYVQDARVKLGRIQVINNWSPYMVKNSEETVWLGLEYFCNEGDVLWEMPNDRFSSLVLDELIHIGVIASASDILYAHRERVKKAYPAYFNTYSEFDMVRGFLDSIENLYCIGRNGQHKYNNMDHSMITAFRAVEKIASGKIEKSSIWNVNTERESLEQMES